MLYTEGCIEGFDSVKYSTWGMRGDGNEARLIVEDASEPALSPDGRRFAFYEYGDHDGIYLWNFAQQQRTRLITDHSDASFPTWAPDGQRLAYYHFSPPEQDIFTIKDDGSGQSRLTPGIRPHWSPQGDFIAYDTCIDNACGLHRISPGGGEPQRLTSDNGTGAAVSPDGTQIAYWSQADGDPEIYVMDADGSGLQQLTNNNGNDAVPAWSPDGKYLYFLSDQEGGGWAVMRMEANGANPHPVQSLCECRGGARGWQNQRISVGWYDGALHGER